MPQPNMRKMLEQAQQMQADMQRQMAEVQEQLRSETFEGSAGGGAVAAVVTGELELREVRIDPGAADPEDVEMLQDMVVAAVNQALRSAEQAREDRMGSVMGSALGGLGGPGGLGGLLGM